ncbi:hypothetical protein [Halodesulfovibrio aestuarii]|uniref:hypothetical protein n=1 Tax=Halodesulfovibrio aestuarii TaxID=126333 RepID=UPI000379B0EF|nr:hypothetical protein [Halodesulfovibrio aestuarii]
MTSYIAQTGETFDAIARNLWNDERLFQRLVDANPQYRTVVFFAGGETLNVPNLPAATTTIKAPWE